MAAAAGSVGGVVGAAVGLAVGGAVAVAAGAGCDPSGLGGLVGAASVVGGSVVLTVMVPVGAGKPVAADEFVVFAGGKVLVTVMVPVPVGVGELLAVVAGTEDG